MNWLFRKLKLYRVITVLKFCKESWRNALFLKEKCQRKSRVSLWLDQIYWYVRYGNDFNDYCTFKFWEKTSQEKKAYISVRRNDYLRYEFSKPDVFQLFLDKARFNSRYQSYVKRGWLTTQGKTEEDIYNFIEKYDDVIAKPLKDYGGHGVIKISRKAENYQQAILEVMTLMSQGVPYILEETIENVDYIKAFAPNSLNTLRFVTVIDNKNMLHVVAALLRMGNGFAVTDNYHDGGMACPINMSDGRLDKSAYGMKCVEYNIHPFSNIKFEGYYLPDFFRCLDIVKEVAFYEPDARYVGWDFAITPQGIELLEGNIPPGEDITQIATGKGIWYEMLKWK